jgi:DNA-binding transcriptional regulator YdaS (Cro superfamily)
MPTKLTEITPEAALNKAAKVLGGRAQLARALGITKASTHEWRVVPVLRVLAVERVSGVSRHELRPDVYPVNE